MDKPEQARAPASEPSNPFMLPTGELAHQWAQSTQRFASAMAAVSAEMMKFASRRFAAQAKAWEACSHCSDLPTLTQTQGKFLSDMASDYVNEASELMRRAQEILANGGEAPSK